MEKNIILKKQDEVKALTEKYQNSKVVIAFDYQGLTVEDLSKLRISLREKNCDCKVYKNNIAKRAAEAGNFEGFGDIFAGPKAILFSESEIVEPAKILNDFAKSHDKVKIGAGIVEGVVVGPEKIAELANMPSYEALLTMLAGGMLQPLRDIAVGLNMLSEKMAEA